MTRYRSGPLMGVFLALLVIVSLVPAGSAGPAATEPSSVQQSSTQEDDGLERADEIYVQENGDAVLVYDNEDDSSDPETQGEIGIDVSSNLAYLLVTQPREGTGSGTGQASVTVTPSELVGNGSLSARQPALLEEFSMELSGQSTDQNADGTLTVDATVNSAGTGANEAFNSVTTSGEITSTASQFTATGDFNADLQSTPMTAATSESSFSFALAESNGGYTVEVDRNETIFSFGESQWETRESALAALEEQYQLTADEFDGAAEITLEEYSFTEVPSPGERSSNEYRLDIEYTVEYTDIEGQLADAIARNLTNDPDLDLTEQEAQQFADRLEELSINDVSASYDTGPEAVTADFSADIENYDAALLGFLDIAESADTGGVNSASFQGLDRLRSQLEAQEAANLRQTYTWNGEVTKPDSQSVALDFDADYETENWQAYISELDDRGIETPQTEYEFTGTSTGEQLNFEGRVTVEGDFLGQLTDQLANASADDPEAQRALEAFEQSEFQIARMSANVNESTVTIEGGAQFENMSAIRDALAESEEGFPPGLTSVVARPENGDSRTYVRVEGAVSSGASESDVRALEYVGDDTTVNMPGDWDREFPTLDTERARDYLDIDDGSAGGSDGDGSDGDGTDGNGTDTAGNDTNGTATSTTGPGFGVALAVLAMLASAALLARREQ